MAYDEVLADRVRDLLDRPDLDERKMFGGLAFLLNGNMCVGIIGEELMVRVGADGYQEALAHPNAREMDFTGKALTGFVYVDSAGIAEDADLAAWVDRGVDHAESLPPKAKQPAKQRSAKPKATTKRR